MKKLALVTLGVVALLCCGAGAAYARAGKKPERRRDNSPDVGEMAPDFELIRLEVYLKRAAQKGGAAEQRKKAAAKTAKKEAAGAGKEGEDSGTVRLSSFRGKRPVVFVLTSYT